MKPFPHSDEYGHFVAELRAIRDEAGLTQENLAARLGVERTLVTKAEGGVRRIDVIELRAWLHALGTDLIPFVARLDARLARHAKAGQAKPPARR
jgi:transcriptional regulator with XRE-family HTH domain